MRSAFVISALAALAAASPAPAGISGSIAPSSNAPPGCVPNYNGDFEITPTNLTSSSKRSLKPRDTKLYITLKNGVLTDSQDRTGYVASNQQFQFDDPPQAGAIYTAGFSVCANGSMALGNDAIWYSCLSGNFYNLYFESQGGQCFPVTLQIVGTNGGKPETSAPPAPSGSASPPPPPPPPASGSAPPATSAPAPTSAAQCSEYVDGQPQCSTAAPAPSQVCSEYVDGQPQCSSAAPAQVCSEYVDGQPQCSSAAPAPVCSEYVDGQPQCSSAAAATGTAAVASGSYTGAPIASGLAVAPGVHKELFGLAAGVLAFAML